MREYLQYEDEEMIKKVICSFPYQKVVPNILQPLSPTSKSKSLS